MNRIVTLPSTHRTGLISEHSARMNGFTVPVTPAAGSDGGREAIRFTLPFGVVIGDSISEGVPQTHGRLRKEGAPGFDANHRNKPGQLSYEFGTITGMHWYNHGVGGQRTDQIWARWKRDVLGETFDPADARGDRTLPGQAYAVFIVAGINDVFQGKQDAFIQEHLLKMAEDAAKRGIICIFSDMGEHNAATPEFRDQIIRMNRWMHDKLPSYGATVVDYYEWSIDRSRGYGVNPALFADDVHPSRSGFQSLAYHYAAQWHGLPLVFRGLVLEAIIDYDAPLAGFGRAEQVSLDFIEYGGSDGGAEAPLHMETKLADEPSVYVPIKLDGDRIVVELRINEAYNKAPHSGFSTVRACMGSRFAF
ncbi:hypothetical protein FE783_06635 [Paenibacillus mesophilus]|uniref:GDSL-type esterase/lipase family protein n=1 Tax=Paenibacillus mesophilus TaxID=2582849 RepID=UPI00110F67B2|nr:GDSL-type esterase/lipase family protein [Paenibacillus mesophilus]TMV51449.1 hypothetical protein FE783_06635 [Paenibacillus mesophilus]